MKVNHLEESPREGMGHGFNFDKLHCMYVF